MRMPEEQAWQHHQQEYQGMRSGWVPGVGSGSTSPLVLVQAVDNMAANQSCSFPLRCAPCGEAFSSNTELYDHMRTVHKVYYCVQCSQGFNSSANLCYHRNKLHRQNTDLQCMYCGKFFGHKQNLRLHITKAHKDLIFQQLGDFGTL